MTRRKDKMKQKQEFIKKSKNDKKSRLAQQKDEIEKEEKLLEKIKVFLPDEIIRIIYDFMSGNAKLICNLKFEYLKKKIHTYGIYVILAVIENISKKELLDLVFKGFLRKFPEIIESINDFYYCLDIQKFTLVEGKRLFHLWEKNLLNSNYIEDLSKEESISRIDWSITYYTKNAIYHYLTSIFDLFHKNKSRVFYEKNWIQKENTLFIKLDKVFYICKCLENLIQIKNKVI